MNINIKNNTFYKQIAIVYNNREYILNKGDILPLCCDTNRIHILVYILDKNRVLFNWLYALIDGFINDESVVNVINCNAEFELYFTVLNHCETICIESLETRDGNQCIYDSIYLKNARMAVQKSRYFLTETKTQKNKSLFYQVFITSYLPILVLLLAYFLCTGNVFAAIAGTLILLVFSIPSWRKASKIKKYYSSENAQVFLSMEEIKQRQNNDKPVQEVPQDVIGKAVYNALDKILGKKK